MTCSDRLDPVLPLAMTGQDWAANSAALEPLPLKTALTPAGLARLAKMLHAEGLRDRAKCCELLQSVQMAALVSGLGFSTEEPSVIAAQWQRISDAAYTLRAALADLPGAAAAGFAPATLAQAMRAAAELQLQAAAATAALPRGKRVQPSARNVEIVLGQLVTAYCETFGTWPACSKGSRDAWFFDFAQIVIDEVVPKVAYRCRAPHRRGAGRRSGRAEMRAPRVGLERLAKVVRSMKAAEHERP